MNIFGIARHFRLHRPGFVAHGSRPAANAMPRPVVHDPADTIDGLFRKRVVASPEAVAYLQFDAASAVWREISWSDTAREVARWQAALATLGLKPGERVAMMLGNCHEWVCFDLAALGLGLVTVPIFANDRPDDVSWILDDADCRALLIDGLQQWLALAPIHARLAELVAVIALRDVPADLANLRQARDWLPKEANGLASPASHADALATLVYTSGTTGRPKGVMLSHRNILFNVQAGLQAVAMNGDDLMLSFLPLSHTLERTVGYYLAMAVGCRVAYARSIPQLAEDLMAIRPTVLIAVPRIFERIHGRIRTALEGASPFRQRVFAKALELGWQHFLHQQGRAPWHAGLLLQPALDRLVGARVRDGLGGRLRFAISGGAPLSAEVSQFFIALGVGILQGYGLTEASPVVSVNRLDDNEPTSVGPPLPGIEVRIGEHDELLTRSPSVMMGIWHDPGFTRAILDHEGWLHTGDQASIGPRGHLTITGRIKDILVLSTGEKISPVDIEQALCGCPLVEQVMVVGDGKPYLTALVVPNAEAMALAIARPDLPLAAASGDRRRAMLSQYLLQEMLPCLHAFPGYAKLVRITLLEEPWTVDNGYLTPTLKLRRSTVLHRQQALVEKMYAGH
jgi:long-chain acyl-CoA synthetase